MQILGIQKKENSDSISNVSSGGRGSANITVAGTHYFDALRVLAGGVPATVAEIRRDIAEVHLSINGVDVYTGQSAAEIMDLFSSDVSNKSALGNPQIDGVLLLPLVDMRLDPVAMATKAVGTVGVNTYKIRLVYGSDVAFSIDEINVDCWVTNESRVFEGGEIIRWDSYQFTHSSAGDHTFTGLEVTSDTAAYKDLLIKTSNASTLNHISLKVVDEAGNDSTIKMKYDEIDEAIDGLFSDSAPQAGYLHIRLDSFRLNKALLSQKGLKVINLIFNFSANPGTVDVITRRTVVAKAA